MVLKGKTHPPKADGMGVRRRRSPHPLYGVTGAPDRLGLNDCQAPTPHVAKKPEPREGEGPEEGHTEC